MPVLSVLTITADLLTYVNSNLPLYMWRFTQASYMSTAPVMEPTVILLPSGFHEAALTA